MCDNIKRFLDEIDLYDLLEVPDIFESKIKRMKSTRLGVSKLTRQILKAASLIIPEADQIYRKAGKPD